MPTDTLAPDLVTLSPQGRATVAFHAGQQAAWDSEARFTFVFAGTQGGKTSFVPWWLNREVDRTASIHGANDYLAVTATYDLFKLKLLPEMRKVFEFMLRRGRFWASEKVIELCDPTGRFWARRSDDPMWGRIILRSAQSPGGLESATAKAAVLDECGQAEFTLDNWEAVQRRLSLSQGRVLGATTLYNLGWVKNQIYDPWREGNKDIEVIQFASYINPSFPREEYDRVEGTMPRWKLNMFYRGEFDIPEGLIYGCFDTAADVCDPFPIPDDWLRYGGLDFGGVNTGAVLFAERPEDHQLFLVDEYLEGEKTTKQHSDKLRTWKARRWWGGAKSEEQWRREFGAAGMPIMQPPISEVEVGIACAYAVMATKGMTVFKTCKRWLDEVGTYSRKLDKEGQPTEDIAEKNAYHLLDATRYVLSAIRKHHGRAKVIRLVTE
jgi:hypothetical protein